MKFEKLVPNIFYVDIQDGLKFFVDCLKFEAGRVISTAAILSCLATGIAFGQATASRTDFFMTGAGVMSDTINQSSNRDFEKRIDLNPIDSSNAVSEVRLYRLNTGTKKRNLRLVRFLNGQWESFEFEEPDKGKIRKYVLVPIKGYDAFLEGLVKSDFASLPDQDDLDKRIEAGFASKREYLQSRPGIMDGYEFTVEFKLGDKFRVYRFHSPEAYARYYPNVEFRQYMSVRELFERELERNM